jgi:choline kinase
MEAVILAAGIGWRLGRGEARPPKCLLHFDGRSLLERHLHTLRHVGVERVHLGIGYQAQEIHRELGRIGLPLPVDTVFNPHFHEGNVVTLACMRAAMRQGEDILLMDADVLYDRDILAALAAAPHENCFLMDRDFEPGPEPVKLCIADSRPVEF